MHEVGACFINMKKVYVHAMGCKRVLTSLALTVMRGVSTVTTVPSPFWKWVTDTLTTPPALRGRLSSTTGAARSSSLPLIVTASPHGSYGHNI